MVNIDEFFIDFLKNFHKTNSDIGKNFSKKKVEKRKTTSVFFVDISIYLLFYKFLNLNGCSNITVWPIESLVKMLLHEQIYSLEAFSKSIIKI